MNKKQARRARAAAMVQANKVGLWKSGEHQLYGKGAKGVAGFFRRLALFILKPFPDAHARFKAKYDARIARWYRRVLKKWGKQAFAAVHDKELQAFEAATRKIRRMELMKRRKEAAQRAATKYNFVAGAPAPLSPEPAISAQEPAPLSPEPATSLPEPATPDQPTA